MQVIDEREISPEHRVALRAFSKVLSEPETSGAEVPRTREKKKPRLVVGDARKAVVFAIEPCNGCPGNGYVEIYKGQAIACQPMKPGLCMLDVRIGFDEGFDPSALPCRQCQAQEISIRMWFGLKGARAIKTFQKSTLVPIK